MCDLDEMTLAERRELFVERMTRKSKNGCVVVPWSNAAKCAKRLRIEPASFSEPFGKMERNDAASSPTMTYVTIYRMNDWKVT